MGKTKIKYGESPKFLSEVGRYHYAKTIQQLKDAGLFNPMDTGLIEMLSMLYQDVRNDELSNKDRQSAIKLYFQLKKDFGGTPASRQPLKIKTEDIADSDKDLEGFMEDI